MIVWLRRAVVALLGSILFAAPTQAAGALVAGWEYEYGATAPDGVGAQKPPSAATTSPANTRIDATGAERGAARASRPSTSAFSRGRAAKGIEEGATSQILMRTSKRLQSKFKHAGDFGVTGSYSKANAARFSEAIHQHINDQWYERSRARTTGIQ